MTAPAEKTLGELLREGRERKGLTQAAVAKSVGSSARRVIDWELHDSVPEPEHARKLSRKFDIPLEMFTREAASAPLRRELKKTNAHLQLLEARLDRVVEASARGFEELGHQQHGLGGLGADREP